MESTTTRPTTGKLILNLFHDCWVRFSQVLLLQDGWPATSDLRLLQLRSNEHSQLCRAHYIILVCL